MNTVIYIQKLCGFISNKFPLLALISLLTITIILVFREKRRRKLTLLTPKENEQIDELLKNKAINETEAEKLKKAANALPEVVEEYPLPDIHLRLTAALAKTYSSLKILLIASKIYIFYIIWRIPASANVTKTFKTENIWLSITIFSLLIFSSIIQFTASIHLTRGGRKSRALIAFIWLFDLASLPIVLSGVNDILYSIAAVSACIYSIWVLYLRRDAGIYIDLKAKTSNKIMKAAFACIFLLCLASGIFFLKSDIKYKFIGTSTKTVSNAGLFIGIVNSCVALNKIAIIASTPGKETAAMTAEMLSMLQKQFPKIKFKRLEFKKSFPENEIKFNQFIFVSKTKILKHRETKKTKISVMGKEIILNNFNNPQNGFYMPKSISFNIVMSGRFECFSNYGSGRHLRLYKSNPEGAILITSDISSCSKTVGIKKCAEEAVKNLSKEYRRIKSSNISLNIPDFLAPKLKKVSFQNIKFLKDAWNIGSFRGVIFDNFSIYLFNLKENRKKQKETIIKELKEIGWNYFPSKINSDILSFNKSKKRGHVPQIKIDLPMNDKKSPAMIFGKPKFEETFGRFIYASGNKHRYTAEEANKFKEFDFESYIHCASFYGLKPAELIKIFNRVYNDKKVSFNTLKTLYEKIKGKNLKPLLDKHDKLLIKMGNILKKQIYKPSFNKQLLELATLIAKENKYPLDKHPAFIHFKDRIVKIKLHYEPEFKRYIVKRITISAKKSPVIIQLSNIGKYKNICLSVISRQKLKNKDTELKTNTCILPIPGVKMNSFGASMSCSGKSDTLGIAINMRLASNTGTEISSSLNVHDIYAEPECLASCYNYRTKKDVFEFKATFTEK